MRWLALLPLLLAPSLALAQADQCTLPRSLPALHPELPTADQPRRVLPIGSYTLALTWAPEYCHGHARDPGATIECGRSNRFGFTLHGLWPDGEGAQWPQYCRATALLPAAIVRRQLCATPSPQLVQHEWAKHGTCTGLTPERYFRQSSQLYGRLRFPDMNRLSRQPGLTAGQFAAAFARANPGVPAQAVRVTANQRGWLDELWLCLDRGLAYRACEPTQGGGLSTQQPLRIWRAR